LIAPDEGSQGLFVFGRVQGKGGDVTAGAAGDGGKVVGGW
jgi:hypothetical protein